jgi:hypothetical protein
VGFGHLRLRKAQRPLDLPPSALALLLQKGLEVTYPLLVEDGPALSARPPLADPRARNSRTPASGMRKAAAKALARTSGRSARSDSRLTVPTTPLFDRLPLRAEEQLGVAGGPEGLPVDAEQVLEVGDLAGEGDATNSSIPRP